MSADTALPKIYCRPQGYLWGMAAIKKLAHRAKVGEDVAKAAGLMTTGYGTARQILSMIYQPFIEHGCLKWSNQETTSSRPPSNFLIASITTNTTTSIDPHKQQCEK